MKQNYFYNWNRNKLRLKWARFFALLLMTSFGLNSINAQVNSYIFSQSNGSFNSISGGTVLGTCTANTATAAGLYNTSFPVTLPFSFKFNNINYSALTVASNGYVTFGTGAATNTAPISSTVTYEGAIAAWGRNISGVFDVGGKTSNISWTTEGTAPNRVVVIQWENFRPSYTTSITSASVFSFQIRLAETTNVISSSYSATAVLIGTGTYTSTAQIGLRGATNADYLNRYNPSTISFVNSVVGTANSNAQYYNTTVDPSGMPTDGLTYTWTPTTCIQPSALAASSITTTSATLAWTAPTAAPANGYDVYYSTSNVAPISTTTPTISNIVGTTQDLTSLSPSSVYFVWVRSKCSSTEASNWAALPSFNTLCAPISSMYENFDGYATGSIVPLCWDRIVVGTGSQTISTSTPNSAPNNLYQYSSGTTNYTIVVLPTFSNVNAGTHWVRMKAKVSTAPRTIDFGYVTNAADATSFVLLESKSITNTAYTAVDSEYTFAVPTTVPTNARLAIKNPGTLATALYYDDVYWEPAPNCIAPSSLIASNITTTTATISWGASVSAPANGYDVYYSTTNVAPTSASIPNFSNVAGLSQGLTGLSATTVYYVWVRAKCSTTEASSWASLPSFTTPCDAVATMFENFDTTATGSIVPACWNRIISGAGSQTIVTTTPNSTPNNLYQYSSLPANQTIVVLPPFSNINAGTNWLRLKARVTTAPRTIEFGYVTDPTDANSFVLIESKNITNTLYTSIDSEYTVVVPNTVPANARLAIKNPGTLATTLYYDDVYWEVAPTCLPPSNIIASGTGPTTANVSWTASSTIPGSGYEVYYSTTNTAPTAATVPNLTGITGTSTTISSLTPSTGYYIWVRSKCSTSDISTWSLVQSFNTQCQPPAVLTTIVSPTPVCVGGTGTLSGTTEPGAILNWYDASTGGTLLGTGTYTTPILTATTNYWVSASIGGSSNVGKVSLESNAGTGGGLTSYMVFTAISDFTLQTVDLFPYSATDGTSGTATITLLSSTGALITSKTVNVIGRNSVALSTVPQTVTLDFPVVGGQSYRLGVSSWTGITNMYRDASNLAFPYTLPGVVDITGSSLSNPSYWYFFYNWSVSTKCESARTMVTAIYDSTCNLGTSETSDGKQISVYPNPFTDVLNISDVKGLVSVSITDMSGRTVKSIDKPSTQLHLGELKSGMYLVNLKYKDGSVKTVKAIKK